MKDARLLIFANKQDVGSAMKPDEVKNKLQLDKIAKDHKWKIEPSCATTGEGIFEGLVRYLPLGATTLPRRYVPCCLHRRTGLAL